MAQDNLGPSLPSLCEKLGVLKSMLGYTQLGGDKNLSPQYGAMLRKECSHNIKSILYYSLSMKFEMSCKDAKLVPTVSNKEDKRMKEQAANKQIILKF